MINWWHVYSGCTYYSYRFATDNITWVRALLCPWNRIAVVRNLIFIKLKDYQVFFRRWLVSTWAVRLYSLRRAEGSRRTGVVGGQRPSTKQMVIAGWASSWDTIGSRVGIELSEELNIRSRVMPREFPTLLICVKSYKELYVGSKVIFLKVKHCFHNNQS